MTKKTTTKKPPKPNKQTNKQKPDKSWKSGKNVLCIISFVFWVCSVCGLILKYVKYFIDVCKCDGQSLSSLWRCQRQKSTLLSSKSQSCCIVSHHNVKVFLIKWPNDVHNSCSFQHHLNRSSLKSTFVWDYFQRQYIFDALMSINLRWPTSANTLHLQTGAA